MTFLAAICDETCHGEWQNPMLPAAPHVLHAKRKPGLSCCVRRIHFLSVDLSAPLTRYALVVCIYLAPGESVLVVTIIPWARPESRWAVDCGNLMKETSCSQHRNTILVPRKEPGRATEQAPESSAAPGARQWSLKRTVLVILETLPGADLETTWRKYRMTIATWTELRDRFLFAGGARMKSRKVDVEDEGKQRLNSGVANVRSESAREDRLAVEQPLLDVLEL